MGSSVKACLSLDQDACALRLDYEVDWNERASKQDFVPVLGYELPLGEAVEAFECDVPAGSVVRGVTHHDIPALTHAAACARMAARWRWFPRASMVLPTKNGAWA